MKARGKVLREPSAGPGLLMIDGQQFRFSLDGIWRSDAPPRPGLDVEVELDGNRQVTRLRAIPESQIVRERAAAAMAAVGGEGGKVIEKFRAYALTAALLVGWFSLTTLSIAVPFMGKINFTFWQLLGLVNAPNAIAAMDRSANLNPGAYALFAIIALAGPFLHHFSRDKRAWLGGVAPLVFMVAVWIMARSSIQNAFGANVPSPYREMAREVASAAMNDVSFAFGAFFTGIIGAYFAWTGAKRFLSARAGEKQQSSS